MKKLRKKDEFLEQLKKIPIIQVVCEKVNLSRNTVYRWRKEDEVFAKAMDEALVEGETLVNEMSESQLISMIRDKNWPAISFWLRHRNPKFRNKVEISGTISTPVDKLTPEDNEFVKKAMELSSIAQFGITKESEITNQNINQSNGQETNAPTGHGGSDTK